MGMVPYKPIKTFAHFLKERFTMDGGFFFNVLFY
jgi:hypothetical protein